MDLKRAVSVGLGRIAVGRGGVALGLLAASLASCAGDLHGEFSDYPCSIKDNPACGTTSMGGSSGGGAAATGGAGMTSMGGAAAIPPDDACLAPLFASKCNTCHSTAAAPTAGAHLALDTPNLGASLSVRKATYEGVSDMANCKAGALTIDPTTNAESVLLKKVMTPDCGLKMPFGGQPLTGTDLTCIQDWVMKF